MTLSAFGKRRRIGTAGTSKHHEGNRSQENQDRTGSKRVRFWSKLGSSAGPESSRPAQWVGEKVIEKTEKEAIISNNKKTDVKLSRTVLGAQRIKEESRQADKMPGDSRGHYHCCVRKGSHQARQDRFCGKKRYTRLKG